MRLSIPSFAAGALAAAVLVGVPAATIQTTPTAAGQHPHRYDGTSPALSLQRLSFVVGSTIDAAEAPADPFCSTFPWNTAVPLDMHWTASDPISGLAGFTVWKDGPQVGGPTKVATYSSRRHFEIPGTNYGGDCGGGQEFDNRFWTTALDNRGNSSTTGEVAQYIKVWQENGVDAGGDAARLPLVRTGTWSTSTCDCFNNAKTLYSTVKGASLNYTVTATEPGQVLGVVVDKNSNRGPLKIQVDRGTPVTVGTYRSSARHRVVVWQQVLGLGTHKLHLTNAGTPSHPRVAIDTIMLTNPPLGVSAPQLDEVP